jgi:peptide/nickel transport system ATP-binding protein
MTNTILKFADVSIDYPNGFRAASGVNFSIKSGECVAIVGQSGSGKTTLACAALGILPKGTRISGSIRIGETEIVGASEKTLRRVRGLMAGFVAQEPFSSFNPLARVYDHLAEAWCVHARRPDVPKLYASLEKLGIENARRTADKYPFEWSGGMLQRAAIAAAATHSPAIIIADEPTSALDTDRADSILTALKANEAALLLISHDIGLVRRYADKIGVCFDGRIVEIGEAGRIFALPQHEHTKSLLRDASGVKVNEHKETPAHVVLEAKDLSKTYKRVGAEMHAVKRADLSVREGEIVGICGPSGSGKSTLLRLLATIETPTHGTVMFENELAASGDSRKLQCSKARTGFVMPIFQDPLSSLNADWKIWRIVTEPLEAKHRSEKLSRSEKREIARQILAKVGLESVNLDTKPGQLSVGQCQRISIARALTASPKLIVADEPTSALDVSVSKKIIELFATIAEAGTAIVIVSHDQSMLKSLCHRILRMDDGVLVN